MLMGERPDTSDISIMNDGLRYRKKRKYHEIDSARWKSQARITQQNTEDEQVQKENIPVKEKVFKKSKKKFIEGKTKQDKNDKQVKQLNSVEAIVNETALTVPQKTKDTQSVAKNAYKREEDRVKIMIRKFEEKLDNENLPLLARKLKSKKEIKTGKMKNEVLSNTEIDPKNYPPETALINLELLFVDLLMEKNSAYESILEMDSPNFGNLLLFYFSQRCILKVLRSLLPSMSASVDKHSEVLVIRVKDVGNLINSVKFKNLEEFYQKFKKGYQKFVKIERSLAKGKAISSDYENMILSEVMNNFSDMNIKSIHKFDYEREEVQTLFYNNLNYIDHQLKSSNIYNKAINYAHTEAIDNIKKKIKMTQFKQELRQNYMLTFSKLANLQVYWENTADLIQDFLDID